MCSGGQIALICHVFHCWLEKGPKARYKHLANSHTCRMCLLSFFSQCAGLRSKSATTFCFTEGIKVTCRFSAGFGICKWIQVRWENSFRCVVGRMLVCSVHLGEFRVSTVRPAVRKKKMCQSLQSLIHTVLSSIWQTVPRRPGTKLAFAVVMDFIYKKKKKPAVQIIHGLFIFTWACEEWECDRW